MQGSLSLTSIAALFAVMLVGAAIPSVSVLTVSARSAAFGFNHGLFTTLGIIVGDIIFIVAAIYGLSVVAEWMGGQFFWVKYLGGVYLILLGIMIWKSSSRSEANENDKSTLMSSFILGLLITLGDQKAILFYLGFFPTFVDVSAISPFETGLIIAIAVISIGVAKLSYAFMADRVSVLFNAKFSHNINRFTGGIMASLGIFIMISVYL